MLCPKYFSNTLVSFDVEGQDFTIEQCSRCGGLWFDGGELEKSLGRFAETELKIPPDGKQIPLPCPHCHKKLHQFKYPGTYAKIEMCKTCRGIWLDKNEFEEISVVRKHNCKPGKELPGSPDTSIKGKLIDFINQTIDSLSY